MRVGYILNQYPKVSHSFIRREILALERQGFEVMRIALRGWDSEVVDEQDARERERTRYVLQGGPFPLLWALMRVFFTRPLRFSHALGLAWRIGRRADRPLPVHLVYLAEACLIARWLIEERVACLHGHFGTNPAEVAMLAHLLCDLPWSFTVHGPEEFDKAEFIGLGEKVRHCSFVVAISSYGRSQIYRWADHECWPKVHVVHCGLDPEFLDEQVLPVPSSPRLVCVGRLCEQKGQLLLIEAARRLALDGVDFELVLAGDGDMRATIEALVIRYGLPGRVRITGWISGEQVREEIRDARALVLPSFAEGLPVVIMEAMALGRPVVSTYVAGIPELVTPGEHGWLVPAGDLEALVEALRQCLAAPSAMLRRMGDAARHRVLGRHDMDKEAAKLATLFRHAVDPHGARDARARASREQARVGST